MRQRGYFLACQPFTLQTSTSFAAAAMWQAPAENPSIRLPKRARRLEMLHFKIASAIVPMMNVPFWPVIPPKKNADFSQIEFLRPPPNFAGKEAVMKPSQIYRENADNCAMLAEGEPSRDTPAYKRYRRMEEAWRSLAEEQEWLDGEIPPVKIAVTDAQKSRPSG
jgi:hypothetical protein